MLTAALPTLSPLNPALSAQVTTTVLDDGRELESALVVVGVGARPNTQLLQGQVDVEDQKPGGIPVRRPLQGRRSSLCMHCCMQLPFRETACPHGA